MKDKGLKNICFFIFLIFISMFCYLQTAHAAPASPIEQNFEQPSGEAFKATLQGDEFINWAVDKDTDDVLIKDTDGFWKYGEIKDGKLKAGKEKHKIGKKPKTVLKNKDLKEQIKQKKVKKSQELTTGGPALSSTTGSTNTATSSSGPSAATTDITLKSRKMIVLLVEFSNISIKYTDVDWSNKVFAPSGNSVNSYYNEISMGKFQFSPAEENYGTANDGVIKVKLNYPHPNTGGNIGSANQKIVQDALIAADPYIDYSIFDANGDGVTDNNELIVATVIAGYEAACGGPSPSVWAHRWSLSASNFVLDGKLIAGNKGNSSYVRAYMQEGEIQYNNMAAIGTMCHELGHVLGLPDLYDYDGSSDGIGIHSLMASGSWGRASYSDAPGSSPTHPDAYCLVELGFVTPQVVESSGSFKVSSFDTGNYTVLEIPTSNRGQYFLIENRQFKGYDKSLMGSNKSGGIAIWHIDKMQWGSGNNNEQRKLVDLEEANQGKLGYSQLDTRSGGLYDHYYYSGNNTQFGPSSIPNSNLYEGTKTNILVTVPDASSSSMTVNISLPSILTPKGKVEAPSSRSTIKNICSIKGWVLDPDGVKRVEVWVDGVEVRAPIAAYGDPRPDIAGLYPQYNNVNCGFHYDLDTSNLSEGIHTLTLVEISNTNYPFTIPDQIEIIIPAVQRQGAIEAPMDGQLVRKSVDVSGWFLDSAGVSKIEVLLNGVLKGQATYGDSRPDIAAQYPEYNNPDCGFTFTLDVSNLTDGKYILTVKETSKNAAVTTLPSVEINVENYAKATISYVLSEDAAVTIVITDSSDKVVKTLQNKVTKPAGPNSVKWDGRNSYGQIVDSGIYTYTITATEQSGLVAAPLTGTITVNRGIYIKSATISPNPFAPDGTKKLSIKYVLSQNAKASLTILNNSNTSVFSLSNVDAIAGENTFEWDGKDNAGAIVSDGTYRYKIGAVGLNGASASPVSGSFTVSQATNDAADITLVGDSPDPFDPEKDKINTITFNLSKTANVTATIKDSNNNAVMVISKSNLNAGVNTITWDGKNSSGTVVGKGAYTYEIKVFNSTGTQSKSVSGTITVNTSIVTEAKPVISSISMVPNPFNPADGSTAEISYSISKPCKVTIKILNSSQATVRILESDMPKDQGPNSITWDGKNTSGSTVPDGAYSYSISATDATGQSTSISGSFTVRRLAFSITSVSDTPDPFNANGSNKVAISFTLSQNASSATVTIYDKNNVTVYSVTVNSPSQGSKTVYWDGKNVQGAKVNDGMYTYKINAVDGTGNRSNEATGTIKIDSAPPSITQHYAEPQVISP